MVYIIPAPIAVDGTTLQQDGAGTISVKDGGLGGSKLAASVADGSTLELSGGSLREKDAGTTRAKLVANLGDLPFQMRAAFGGSDAATNCGNGTTTWHHLVPWGAVGALTAANEASAQTRIRQAISLRDLKMELTSNGINSGTVVATLRINGADAGSWTVNFGAGNIGIQTFSGMPQALAVGDLACIRVVVGGTSGSVNVAPPFGLTRFV